MRRFLFLLLVPLCSSVTAFAGPEPIQSSGKETVEPAAPACSWTGFYVGVRIGWGWNAGDVHDYPLPSPQFFDEFPVTIETNSNGVVGGGELGYNWQISRFVLGVEADFSGSDIGGDGRFSPTRNSTSGNPIGFATASENIDWFGTVRPRLGYTITPCLLAYGTGGFAYAHREIAGNVINFGGTETHPASGDEVSTGWTAGGGIEFQFARHWSFKAEYLYLDCGQASVSGVELSNGTPVPPFGQRYSVDTHVHTVTAGLNFHF